MEFGFSAEEDAFRQEVRQFGKVLANPMRAPTSSLCKPKRCTMVPITSSMA